MRRPPTASPDAKFWAAVARQNVIRARQAFREHEWKAYLAADNRQSERDRHRTQAGRLASMKAIRDQLQARGVADDADVEIKATFYKHRTRRFQAVNVWPSEASSSEEISKPIPPKVSEAILQIARYLYGSERADAPTEYVVPQRIRWFKVRTFRPAPPKPGEFVPDPELEDLYGLDVSGSQAQILAVVLGLRDVENQLAETPFKKLMAFSIRTLHRTGKVSMPHEVLENAAWLENVGKDTTMPGLYGGRPSKLAQNTQRDPDRYGPGVTADFVEALFKHDPILHQLLAFLPVAEAVARGACARDPVAGVTVVDPLDGASFTWNPPKRRKQQIRSGAFKLYVKAPIERDGDYLVDKNKLARRIAPGLIHMLDALYASIVVATLNELGVRDVISIHDAFLVPESVHRELRESVYRVLGGVLDGAGRIWLPQIGPLYDVFERYLPATSPEGKAARQWRARWERRLADCEAGRDAWPSFLTKFEGAQFR
jgi:hypothetical protein